MITLVIAAVAGLASAQTEPLHGTVINKSDTGISSVQIVVRSPSEPTPTAEVTTDEDGTFTIPMESLRPGYEIHLHKDGYDDVVVPISPAQLIVADLRIVMQATRKDPPPAKPSATPTPPPSLVTSEARKKAVELYNKGIEAWEEAKSADDKGEIEERQAALQMIRQSASLDPTFAEPLIVLSRLALKNQNWAEASRYSEDLIRIDPNDIDAVRTLYLCMVVMRHHHRIGDAARRLVALDPNTIDSVEDHALAFFNNEIYVMARAMYEALTEISPDPANAYLNLGLCCAALGDVEGTRAAFEAFLEHAPEDHPSIESVKNDLAALDEPAVPEALRREEIPGPLE
ncbi:MAG: tetratricopeptide repeat protein [Candidatus Sulfomarinibacteraceae bacterium]